MTGSDLLKRWKVMRKILGLDNSQLVNAQKFIVNDSVISDEHDIAKKQFNLFARGNLINLQVKSLNF